MLTYAISQETCTELDRCLAENAEYQALRAAGAERLARASALHQEYRELVAQIDKYHRAMCAIELRTTEKIQALQR